MNARNYRTETEEQTIELGRALALELSRPCCVLLIGNLGAGKTTLSKGIVSKLTGISEDEISSPTYTLIHEYAPDVHHVDLYRLDTAREVEALGLDELLETSVVLVEWGERFPQLFPKHRVEIRIEPNGSHRDIMVSELLP